MDLLIGEYWVRLPKIGKVEAVIHRPWVGRIKNVTVTKTKSGRYFASVQVEVMVLEIPVHKTNAIGGDVGLKSFLVISDGITIASPKNLDKAAKKLARLQHRLSRCQKGSARREHLCIKVARQHEKVANQRVDFLDKTSRWLVDSYGMIAIEDLNIQGMVQNRHLARRIADAGWGELCRQLVYKARWNGIAVVVIDRFFPSSKTCSCCGYQLAEMDLATRKWVSPACGTQHDRDRNAAQNFLKQAQLGLEWPEGTPREMLSFQPQAGWRP